MKKIKRIFVVVAILGLFMFNSSLWAQYTVGESLNESSLAALVSYCANGSGSETIAELLTPAAGEPTRVLWLNFFESW